MWWYVINLQKQFLFPIFSFPGAGCFLWNVKVVFNYCPPGFLKVFLNFLLDIGCFLESHADQFNRLDKQTGKKKPFEKGHLKSKLKMCLRVLEILENWTVLNEDVFLLGLSVLYNLFTITTWGEKVFFEKWHKLRPASVSLMWHTDIYAFGYFPLKTRNDHLVYCKTVLKDSVHHFWKL